MDNAQFRFQFSQPQNGRLWQICNIHAVFGWTATFVHAPTDRLRANGMAGNGMNIGINSHSLLYGYKLDCLMLFGSRLAAQLTACTNLHLCSIETYEWNQLYSIHWWPHLAFCFSHAMIHPITTNCGYSFIPCTIGPTAHKYDCILYNEVILPRSWSPFVDRITTEYQQNHTNYHLIIHWSLSPSIVENDP